MKFETWRSRRLLHRELSEVTDARAKNETTVKRTARHLFAAAAALRASVLAATFRASRAAAFAGRSTALGGPAVILPDLCIEENQRTFVCGLQVGGVGEGLGGREAYNMWYVVCSVGGERCKLSHGDGIIFTTCTAPRLCHHLFDR